MAIEPVPVVLAGFGWWARNRTVIPILEENPQLMRITAITAIKEKEKEYSNLIRPLFISREQHAPPFIEDLSLAFKGETEANEPKAVIINSPNKLHFDQAKEALYSNLHVYIERPIVCANDDLELLIDLANKKKRLLFNGVQRRMEDNYKYLHQVVTDKYNFNNLTSIRCYLSAGRSLQGWRLNKGLAGGGIVIDEGYHLLDCACWIASAAGVSIHENLSGSVFFSNDKIGLRKPLNEDLERTAIGYINLPTGVTLSFDLSYQAPLDSIYERIELRDDEGARVTLTRDQNKRSMTPGVITHQKPNGSLVEVKALNNFSVLMDKANLSGQSKNKGPMIDFLEMVQGENSRDNIMSVCDARLSVNTWHLIRNIYDIANKNQGGV